MMLSHATTPSAAERAAATGSDAAHLLVATNGRNAAPVVTAARIVAGRLGVAPQVIVVSEPTGMYLPEVGMTPLLPELEVEQRNRLIADVKAAVGAVEEEASAWPIEVVVGQPARTIARLARERRARMIVMGIGRHEPMDRLLGSETTLITIREADRPVLAVAPGLAAPLRRAVVAMDFSAASVRAAEEALALLDEGGTLTLVHVRPPADILSRLGDQTLRWSYDDRVRELFERLVALLAASPSVTVERVVLEGGVADSVLEFAGREKAGLIATGSSGLGFVERLVVGSVATRILRRATVSVLAVPRPSSSEVERIDRQLNDVGEVPESARWSVLLEAFDERNMGRPTRLEIDDPDLGAQFEETGYTLLGASYDRRSDQLQLMLGAPSGGGAHLTHTVGAVTSVAVLADPRGRDMALQVKHGSGQTILTFTD